MRSTTPSVSVVMVAFGGGWEWVPRALEALDEHTREAYEVVLVDNGGLTGAPPRIDDPWVDLVRNRANVGFGPASNQGAGRARGEVLVFLNPDALVHAGWLEPLVERVGDPRVGAAFPAKVNLDGTMQEAGAFVTGEANAYVFGDGEPADAPELAFVREVDFGSAAAMCTMRSRFEAMAGFDPAYRIAYYEDADLCFRLRDAGLKPMYVPGSRVTHARSVSAPPAELSDVYAASREVFVARWGRLVDGRPGYEELAADRRARLAARDFYARERVLVARDAAAAERIAALGGRALVTLLASAPEESRLHALGIETAPAMPPSEWLAEREGHYTHLLLPPTADPQVAAALRASQPQAAVVDSAEAIASAFTG